MTSTNTNLPTIFLNLLPGITHAFTITATGYPFDTLKTRLQTQMYPNAYQCLKQTIQKEGVLSLYRGATTPLISHSLKRPYQFPLFDYLTEGPPQLNRYIAGALAGSSGSLIGTPLQVIKVNTQSTTQKRYKNSLDFIKIHFQNNFISGFYQGFGINLIKDALFGGTFLGTYDFLKTFIPTSTKSQSQFNPYYFLCGASAHCFTWSILIPVDYIKTKVQTENISLTQVLKETPVRIYWKGIIPACLRTIPVSGLGMMCYEYVKKWSNHKLQSFNTPK